MSQKYFNTCPFAKNEYLPAGAGCPQVDAYCGRTRESRGKIDPALCQGCLVEKNRRNNSSLNRFNSSATLVKKFSSLSLKKLHGQTRGKLLDVIVLDFRKGVSPELEQYLSDQGEYYKDEICVCLVFIGNKSIPFLDVSKLYNREGKNKSEYYKPMIGKVFSFLEYTDSTNNN